MSFDDVSIVEMGSDDYVANEDLERFLQDLRMAFPAQTPSRADAHLAAMFEAAHLLADNGDPVARPVSNADAPAPQVSRPPKRRRTTMSEKKLPIRARALRVLAPAIAAFTVLGVMASANALPRTIQHAASTAAGWVGVDLPDTEGGDPATSEDDQGLTAFDSTDDTSKDDTVAPEDTEGDAGSAVDAEDDQGDSTDATATEDNQGDDNSQGDSNESSGSSSEDNQGDNSQGDSNESSGSSSEDNQGDSSDTASQDDQGDTGGDATTSSSSGDSQT
jgi:hypothetical protein